MQNFRQSPSFRLAKSAINKILSRMGLKMVNSCWGPCGFANTLKRIKEQNVIPRQIVDVGAARGEWYLECLSVFPEADYFLVDPLDENKDTLCKLEQDRHNIKMWSGALGPRTCQVPFYTHGDQSSFLESEYSKSDCARKKMTQVRTLDSFLEDGTIQKCDMIKIDVQGYELEVLKGAEACLKDTELLLIEVSFQQIYENSPLADEVISYASSKGFHIFDICSYATRPFDGKLAQSDMLFARKNSILFSDKGWGVSCL